MGNGCTLIDCEDSGSTLECSTPGGDIPIDPSDPTYPSDPDPGDGDGDDPESECSSEGANPFSVVDGNVRRRVDDLSIKGSGLVWSRYHNSIARTEYADRSLGNGGGWRHRWQYDLVGNVTEEYGEILEFDYPNGRRTFLQKQADGTYAAPDGNPEIARVLTDGGVELTTASGTLVRFVRCGSYGKYARYAAVALVSTSGREYSMTRDADGRLLGVSDPEGRTLAVSYKTLTVAGSPYKEITEVTVAPAQGQWLEIQIPTEQRVPCKAAHVRVRGGAAVAEIRFFTENSNEPLPGSPLNSYCAAGVDGREATYYQATAAQRTIGCLFAAANPVVSKVRVLVRPGTEERFKKARVVLEPASVPSVVYLVITKVETSDGRAVSYDYGITDQGLGKQIVLTTAQYGDGTNASYKYSSKEDEVGGGALLTEADDPRFSGVAKHVQYSYYNPRANGLPAGTISAEINPATGHAWAKLIVDSSAPFKRQVEYSDDRIHTYMLNSDRSGRISERIDSLGRSVRYEYGSGRWSRPIASADHAGRRQEWTRDARGRVIVGKDKQGRFSQTERDTRGRVLQKVDRQKRVTQFTRDSSGRITKIAKNGQTYEFTRDASGRVVRHISSLRKASYTYDSLSRLSSAKDDNLGGTTRYEYDKAGFIASVTDAIGRVTRYERTERGLVTAVIMPSGARRFYSYDSYGRKVSETDEAGKTLKYTYDNLGRRTSITNARGQVTTFAYSEFPGGCGSCTLSQRPTKIGRPDGTTTEFLYDAEGRLLSQTVAVGTPAQATTVYGYDSDDNLVSVTDPLGRVTLHTYDDDHHRTSTTDPLGRITKWTYDDNGKVETETTPIGGVTRYTYDELNRRTSVTDALTAVRLRAVIASTSDFKAGCFVIFDV